MREIALGSRNKAKIKAAENAARKLMGASKVTSVDVDGGFDQPMSTEQGREGARRRAERALEEREADVGVGVEGFVEQIKGKMFLSNWAVVSDGENYGEGSSGMHPLPQEFAERLPEDELAEVIHGELGHDLHEQGGAIAAITNRELLRSEFSERALLHAFTEID